MNGASVVLQVGLLALMWYPLSRRVSTRAELVGFTRSQPLGLLQGPIPEDYPLKPISQGSEF